ncbi:transmembrane protein 241 [Phyllostomus discolor]|uniref:Transmembrane protein 241 n=1 Tax=Phyllostomus discolor TaxID=89673 RepID=A0A833ZB39_9CHIR|nr:transmembrane protein 241 [Phyllostomus discolor]
MCMRRGLVGLSFCTCYLAFYLTNKYVLSVLKFTYPTLFQGWQTLIGGLLLHVSWKLGWVEINHSSRSNVLTWLPASVLFVGIIYAGSRALSRLAIPVFLTLHNAAEVIICGHQKCFRKEKTSPARICSALFLLAAAGCLPFNDAQFDPDGYFWAVIHLFCMGAYKILQKSQKPNALSDIDQQYLNYIFSVVLLAFASHPTGKHYFICLFVLRCPFSAVPWPGYISGAFCKRTWSPSRMSNSGVRNSHILEAVLNNLLGSYCSWIYFYPFLSFIVYGFIWCNLRCADKFHNCQVN